ncbi:hypothetical protein ACQZV8_19060, partial [Magnetococcales bacterium HHB-1]
AIIRSGKTEILYWEFEKRHKIPGGDERFINEVRRRYSRRVIPYIKRYANETPGLKDAQGIMFNGGIFLQDRTATGDTFQKAVVIAHEVGHLLHFLFSKHLIQSFQAKNNQKQATQELKVAATLLYPNIQEIKATKDNQRFLNYLLDPNEILAEWCAYRLAFPKEAMTKVPTYTHFFNTWDQQVRCDPDVTLPHFK